MNFSSTYLPIKKYIYDLSLTANPLGYSKNIKISLEKLSLYPDLGYPSLKRELSKKYKLSEQNISIGAGADGIIDDLIHIILKKNSTLILPRVTFQNPAISAHIRKSKVIWVPMTADFSIDINVFLRSSSPELIFLCNPNNPTGKILPLKSIEELLDFFGN